MAPKRPSVDDSEDGRARREEQEEKAVHLPEDNPAGFAIIVEWLYADKIAENLDWGCMLRAYNAARRFGMSDLQNALVDVLRAQFVSWKLNPEWASYFWKNTIEGCPLRKLVLDLFYHQVLRKPDAYKKGADAAEANGKYVTEMEQLTANAQLVTALFWRFADPADRPSKEAFKTNTCFYHVHEDGKECT
ncbi:hypothetical protein CLAIMM_05836 [Cladophialophora immunda]|nr:hypothetical protein CLAIMM_05836 [Cladophialophora immunda]